MSVQGSIPGPVKVFWEVIFLDLEWFILTQIFAQDVHYKFEYYGHGIIKLIKLKIFYVSLLPGYGQTPLYGQNLLFFLINLLFLIWNDNIAGAC